jgi:Rrf2 family protein
MTMQLSRSSEYGVRAMVYLAMQPAGRWVGLREIAETQEVPQPYLAKVLRALVNQRLVKSSRGVGGGFGLAKPAAEVTLRQVIEAIEGPLALNRCVLPGGCPRIPHCPVHCIWREAQARVMELLESANMEDLARRAKEMAS